MATETRTVVITEVNLSEHTISGRDQFGQNVLINNSYNQSVTVVPQKDDIWQISKIGAYWFLDRKAENKNILLKKTELSPGDTRLEATNKLHINAPVISINGEDFDPEDRIGVEVEGVAVGTSGTINFKSLDLGGINFNGIYDVDLDRVDIYASYDPELIIYVQAAGGGDVEFLNSWVNYGDPWQQAAFWRDSAGWVHLMGLIKSGSVAAIFTLPEGYRPTKSHLYLQDANVGMARIDVTSDGNVTLQSYKASGTNAYVSLDGISFPTTAAVGDVTTFVSHVTESGKEVRITGT